MRNAVEILDEIKLLPMLERLALSKLINDMLIDSLVSMSIDKDLVGNPMATFREKFEFLSRQITPNVVSEAEILAEIKAYRAEKTAKENV